MLQISQKEANSDVKACLDLYLDMEKLVNDCFDKSKKLLQALKDAMSGIMNASEVFMAFKLAAFIDQMLRVALRSAGRREIQAKLADVMKLVEMLENEDHFLRQYEQLTAMRLINETSVSREAEEVMVERLVSKYGRDQLSRLKQMFVDIDLSETMLSRMLIEDHRSSKRLSSINLNQKHAGTKIPG